MDYHNEIDPFCGQWLRNLIAEKLLPPGYVDVRSIHNVRPSDLDGFTRCHFFSGLGGWPFALRIAGVPDDRPLWTGSCPCQPFSNAGKRGGTADARHLWPEMFRLVRECRPAIVFGEQVESAVRHGWLDGVFGDLEGEGYACGAAVLGAHSVGAPHIRQRLFWMADADGRHGGDGNLQRGGQYRCEPAHGVARRLEHAEGDGREQRRAGADGRGAAGGRGAGGVGYPDGGDAAEKRAGDDVVARQWPAVGGRAVERAGLGAASGDGGGAGPGRACGAGYGADPRSPWHCFDLLPCTDGKARRSQSAAQRLVDGLPGSLGQLRTELIAGIEKEVTDYGQKAGCDPREVVRGVWCAVLSAAESMRRMGERTDVRQETVLLAVLCQLAQQGWPLAQGISRQSAEEAGRILRMLRYDQAAARPPCERGLAGQQLGQPTDSLHFLSSVLACYAQEAWDEAIPTHAAAVFPLAVGVANRVGKLRAYGNAIVPQVAAEFIAAAMECRP